MKPSVLFVTETFLKYGGVETRVRMYAEAYRRKGWNVYIKPTIYRAGYERKLFDLGNNCFVNTCLLLFWSVIKKIKIIEYQSGSEEDVRFFPRVLHFFGIKLGIVFHGKAGENLLKKINLFDYSLCVSEIQKIRQQALSSCVVVPNALPRCINKWKWANQSRALYISRLDEDKRPSLEAFVSFCLKFKVKMDIAGEGYLLEELKRKMEEKYGAETIHFLGGINTMSFLKKSIEKYLFIGGIGNVALEALSVGYPVLVSPLVGKENCFFVKETNYEKLRFCNFSPHNRLEIINFEQDVRNVKQDIINLHDGKSGETCLSPKIISQKYDFDAVFERYWLEIVCIK